MNDVGTEEEARVEEPTMDGESSSEEAAPAEVVVDEPSDELFLSPDDSDGEEVSFISEPVEVLPAVDDTRVLELEARVEELIKERDDFKNRLMRTAADLENFRKRTARERDDLRKFGIDKVVVDLLPVIDNLDRALVHSDTSADASGIVDGVRMVLKQFITSLEKHGVKGFAAKGEAFDPTRHEAIQQIETPDHETGTVMEEYQKGYFLHERLIRPAMVSVARKIEAPAPVETPEVAEAEIVEAEVVEAEIVDTVAEPQDSEAPTPEEEESASEAEAS